MKGPWGLTVVCIMFVRYFYLDIPIMEWEKYFFSHLFTQGSFYWSQSKVKVMLDAVLIDNLLYENRLLEEKNPRNLLSHIDQQEASTADKRLVTNCT